MKRAGFTMIELIFVIVILGILAAVAVPKFLGVTDQAKASVCESFVGTLNRSVGPNAWAKSVLDGNGSVKGILSDSNVTDYVNIPGDCGSSVINSKSFTFGTTNYDMNFTDGDSSTPPSWTWTAK